MSTDDDEAIARALAHEEQERADAPIRNNTSNWPFPPPAPAARRPVVVVGRPTTAGGPTPVVHVNCPGGHGLNEFLVSYAQRVDCKICKRTLRRDERAFGCVVCQFDVCASCKTRPPSTYVPPTASTTQPFPFPTGNAPPMQSYTSTNQTHMCIAPCILGDGICVEMMVDTGAQSSVISITLARQLGLESRMDRSQQGVAAGVGRARIMGKLRNVVCSLGAGHVEFPMDFIVLDVAENILLLGLDLMRRYKCIVDLERDVLVFGGKGGVEVPLLPADEQHISLRNSIGCPLS